MKLKHSGFSSDPVSLDFPPAGADLVGPSGSGKSRALRLFQLALLGGARAPALDPGTPAEVSVDLDGHTFGWRRTKSGAVTRTIDGAPVIDSKRVAVAYSLGLPYLARPELDRVLVPRLWTAGLASQGRDFVALLAGLHGPVKVVSSDIKPLDDVSERGISGALTEANRRAAVAEGEHRACAAVLERSAADAPTEDQRQAAQEVVASYEAAARAMAANEREEALYAERLAAWEAWTVPPGASSPEESEPTGAELGAARAEVSRLRAEYAALPKPDTIAPPSKPPEGKCPTCHRDWADSEVHYHERMGFFEEARAENEARTKAIEAKKAEGAAAKESLEAMERLVKAWERWRAQPPPPARPPEPRRPSLRPVPVVTETELAAARATLGKATGAPVGASEALARAEAGLTAARSEVERLQRVRAAMRRAPIEQARTAVARLGLPDWFRVEVVAELSGETVVPTASVTIFGWPFADASAGQQTAADVAFRQALALAIGWDAPVIWCDSDAPYSGDFGEFIGDETCFILIRTKGSKLEVQNG